MSKWQLPNGWEWKKLSEVSEINPRRPAIQRNDGQPTSFVPMEDVNEVEGKFRQVQTRPYGEVKRGYTYFEEGDVLLAKITPSMENGKTAIAYNLIDGFGFGTTEFHVFRPINGIKSDWIHYFIRRTAFRNEAKQHFRGAVGQQRVPTDFLESYEIPVPYPDNPSLSLDVQRRIVARIETLLTEVREMRELHQKVLHDTEQLIRSVLVQSFSEIQNQYPSSETIGDLTEVTSGGTPSRSHPEYYLGNIPWIKTGELKDNIIYEAEEYITQEAIDNSNAKLFPVGTLLIAMYGQGQTRGRTGILGVEATTNQACCAIYPNPLKFESKFLQFWFRYMYVELRQQSEARGGTQPNLNQTIIKSLRPPLPDKKIQRHYIALFEQVEQEIIGMLKIESEHETYINQLENTILSQAFRGEL
jgi:type I restriction enzyme S subunit